MIRSLPGISSAALVDILPFHGDESRGAMHIEGRIPKPGERARLHAREVTPDYLRTMGVQLIRGRDISNVDVAGGKAVGVISAAAARAYWPDQDPIGHRFTFNDEDKDWIEVVGIAADVKHNNLTADATPDVYLAFGQKSENDPADSFEIAVRSTEAPNALEPALRSQVRAIDAELPVGKNAMAGALNFRFDRTATIQCDAAYNFCGTCSGARGGRTLQRNFIQCWPKNA